MTSKPMMMYELRIPCHQWSQTARNLFKEFFIHFIANCMLELNVENLSLIRQCNIKKYRLSTNHAMRYFANKKTIHIVKL